VRELAERVAARAIRESVNFEAVIVDLLRKAR